MLNDATGFKKLYIAAGYTDLRGGIDRLSLLIKERFGLNPFESGTLFLFCGRRNDRIKGLVWEEDGFLLLYKRLEAGKFRWPRHAHEARAITQGQYVWLMQGLSIEQKKLIPKIRPKVPA